MYVDLHIHTDSSDGTWNIDELMSLILENNITVFSITDHDTIKNSKRMLQKAEQLKEQQICYVIGVEISCTYMDTLYHITTYAFDHHNEALLDLLKTNKQIMQSYNDRIILLLKNTYPEIDYGKYETYQNDNKRGGWKALNFLLDEGIVRGISEFFEIIKDLDNQLVFRDPVSVLKTIREANGFPFLAHPNAYFQGDRMPEEEIRRWIEFGIVGLECYSSYFGLEDSQYYVDFCRKNDLFISAGSDCHGTFVPDRKLAHPKVTLDMVNLGFPV